MKDGYIWLGVNLVYERVMIIPCGYWSDLYEYEWNKINSTIKGML